MARITIQPFFDPKTWTVSYVVADGATKQAALSPVACSSFETCTRPSKAPVELILR